MADIFYKKPNGEVIKYEPGRMKKSSCDSKYTECDAKGKAIEKKAPKEKATK